MNKFNNEAYEALVSDLINDTFYLNGASRRGTISKIRQLTEVNVRRILDIPQNDRITLGNHRIVERIEAKNNSMLTNAVKNINCLGSLCTHTQVIREITEEEVKSVIDSLFERYAYLLIEYFEIHEFGSNNNVVYSFSILPPIVRYIALNNLYSKYPENLMIIDKLSLVMLKALNREAAVSWIETRKDVLQKTHSVTEDGYLAMIVQHGQMVADFLYTSAPNMYDLCIERVNLVGDSIDKRGLLYNDFESAIDHYKEKGILSGTSPDVVAFNSVMEFLYLGRKSYAELN